MRSCEEWNYIVYAKGNQEKQYCSLELELAFISSSKGKCARHRALSTYERWMYLKGWRVTYTYRALFWPRKWVLTTTAKLSCHEPYCSHALRNSSMQETVSEAIWPGAFLAPGRQVFLPAKVISANILWNNHWLVWNRCPAIYRQWSVSERAICQERDFTLLILSQRR
jgi:hypothetical protein